MKLNPAYIRIGLRYLAGALVTYGLVSPETADVLQNDPMITGAATAAAGVVLGFTTEVIYGMAIKFGWRK